MLTKKRDHGIEAVTWWGTTVPTTGPVGTTVTWAGVNVKFAVNGRLAGFRWYKNAAQTDPRLAVIGDRAGPYMLRACLYSTEGVNIADGWNQIWMRPWFRIDTSITYGVAVLFQAGGYWRTNTALAVFPVTHNNIQFYSGWQTTAADPIRANPTGNTNANAVDVLFVPD